MVSKKDNPFYGWYIVAGCMFMRLGFGISSYSLSVFLKPLCAALNVSRGVFSASSTFSNVATMIMLPILGVWFKKYNFKRIMWIGAIVTTAVLFGYSCVTSVTQYYILSAINGLFGGMINSIPIAMLMANWFKKRRAFATGLAFTGSGVSAMVVAPLANYLIDHISWNTAFRVMGVLYLAFMFIPLLFIIKVKPEDMGLVALGADEEEPEGIHKTLPRGLTTTQALKCPTFWIIGTCMFLTGFAYMGTQNHIVSYLSDIGHTTSFAAAAYSIVMFFDTIGKIVLGLLYDKIGLRKTNLYIYGLFFTAELLLLFAESSIIAVVFAVALGMSVAVQTGAYPVIINRLLGDRDYSQIYGNLTVCYFAGMAVGIPFSGFVFDQLGSYKPAFFSFLVIIACTFVMLLLAEKTSKRDLKKCEAIAP